MKGGDVDVWKTVEELITDFFRVIHSKVDSALAVTNGDAATSSLVTGDAATSGLVTGDAATSSLVTGDATSSLVTGDATSGLVTGDAVPNASTTGDTGRRNRIVICHPLCVGNGYMVLISKVVKKFWVTYDVNFIEEPMAALHTYRNFRGSQHIVVFDGGGGTTDCIYVKVHDGGTRFEIVSKWQSAVCCGNGTDKALMKLWVPGEISPKVYNDLHQCLLSWKVGGQLNKPFTLPADVIFTKITHTDIDAVYEKLLEKFVRESGMYDQISEILERDEQVHLYRIGGFTRARGFVTGMRKLFNSELFKIVDEPIKDVRILFTIMCSVALVALRCVGCIVFRCIALVALCSVVFRCVALCCVVLVALRCVALCCVCSTSQSIVGCLLLC